MFTISRTFARRNSETTLGAVTFQAPDGDYLVNSKVLPKSSVEHLLMFALQSLQDAYAGAADDADAKAKFDAKLTKLLEGKIGVRQPGGAAVSDETRHIRIILRSLVAAAVGKAEWKAMDEADKLDTIDAASAGLSDADKAAVDERVADAIAAEKAKAGLKIAVSIKK